MEREKFLLGRKKKVILFMLTIIIFLGAFLINVSAESGKTEVKGTVYEFSKDEHYDFRENINSQEASDDNTYGSFYISGNISAIGESNGIPIYEIADGNVTLFYNYTDTLLNADIDSWHLVADKSKKVADLTLDANIMKGAIVIQTSKDRKTWVDVRKIVNAFEDTPIRTNSIYTTTDMQLLNGCYYRVMVVYELAVRTEQDKFLFINTDKYEYKKYAEVYEFYGCNEKTTIEELGQTYSLGSKVKAENFDGYFGEKIIGKKDAHYGWDLGDFFISGYTDETTDTEGNTVFLKNVGDKVTLWFKLNQDINNLNNKDNMSITADTEGYDQYFETPKMDFGRGALIIRYTDHNNVKSEPTIYKNYLEANAIAGVDTKVQLFEEGDYEVALDYEITSDGLIDKIGHYRIFFRFSVRNGNCMVYPFDIKTGEELSNSSMTENGFRLDLAKSRYLKVNIKREKLKDTADGLVEDTRFNGPAKEGAEYTEEGIYIITVHNEYTGQLTTKKIYVGTNNLMKAHMTTGLSISEINELLSEGAEIMEDGSIQFAAVLPFEEDPEISIETTTEISEQVTPEETEQPAESKNGFWTGILLCLLLGALLWTFKIVRKKNTRKENTDLI